MAGGGSSSQVDYSTIPGATDLFANTIPKIQATQNAAPLSQFADPQVKGTAGLSPLQQWAQTQIQNIPNTNAPTQAATGYAGNVANQSANLANTANQSALQQLSYLTSGDIGSSPATQAVMSAYDQLQAPSIQNTLNAMGMGRSGAGAEQLNLGRTAALAPALQQEVQNRATAASAYGNMGNNATQAGLTASGQLGTLGQNQTNNLATAATLGGTQGSVEQQTAQAALNAPYEDFLRRQNLAQGVTTLSGMPAATGSTTQNTGAGFFGK